MLRPVLRIVLLPLDVVLLTLDFFFYSFSRLSRGRAGSRKDEWSEDATPEKRVRRLAHGICSKPMIHGLAAGQCLICFGAEKYQNLFFFRQLCPSVKTAFIEGKDAAVCDLQGPFVLPFRRWRKVGLLLLGVYGLMGAFLFVVMRGRGAMQVTPKAVTVAAAKSKPVKAASNEDPDITESLAASMPMEESPAPSPSSEPVNAPPSPKLATAGPTGPPQPVKTTPAIPTTVATRPPTVRPAVARAPSPPPSKAPASRRPAPSHAPKASRKPKSFAVRLAAVEALLRRGRAAQASRALERLPRSRRGRLDVRLLRARCLEARGLIVKTVETLEAAAKAYARSPRPHIRLAWLKLREADRFGAIASLRRAHRLAPRNPSALNGLVGLLLAEADASPSPADDLLSLAKRARALRPDDPLSLSNLGLVYQLRGDGARALPLLERAVGKRPRDGQFRFRFAQALIAAGRVPEARRQLERLLGVAPRHPKAATARAWLATLD